MDIRREKIYLDHNLQVLNKSYCYTIEQSETAKSFLNEICWSKSTRVMGCLICTKYALKLKYFQEPFLCIFSGTKWNCFLTSKNTSVLFTYINSVKIRIYFGILWSIIMFSFSVKSKSSQLNNSSDKYHTYTKLTLSWFVHVFAFISPSCAIPQYNTMQYTAFRFWRTSA